MSRTVTTGWKRYFRLFAATFYESFTTAFAWGLVWIPTAYFILWMLPRITPDATAKFIGGLLRDIATAACGS